MQILFRTAGSNTQLDSIVDTSQTLGDSLQRTGPSPVVVFSDNNHFKVILANAVSKMVTLFDPFGNGFPTSIQNTVQTFFDKDPFKTWTCRVWSQTLQTDACNCGIWAIWVTERWMQYWTEEDGQQPFDCWLKQHTYPIPDIQQQRQRYHDMISAASVIGSNGQSQMYRIDRIIAKMWVDAARHSNQSDTRVALTSADASMTLDTGTSPGTAKGQCTNIEQKLKGRAAEVAKPTAKHLSLQARRRRTSQRSAKTSKTLGNNKHQSRRHLNTVQANSSVIHFQKRPSTGNDSTNSTRQGHNTTNKQQRVRPANLNEGTMLDFLKPNSKQTKNDAPTRTNTAQKGTRNTKRKSCETEPDLVQCSKNEQTTSIQGATEKRQKAEGIFCDRYEELRLMTWNVMGTRTVLDELQTLAQEHKPCVMVLTKTKLTELEQDRKMLSTCLRDYKLYHSRVKGHKTGKQRTSSAGITIAVHTSLTTQHLVQLINLDHPAAKGHCKRTKLQPPGSEALTIWGVYVPCTDMHTRKEVYNLLQTEMQAQDKLALEAG